jgi:hypothetical protein
VRSAEGIGGRGHRPHVERLGDVPCQAREERLGNRGVPDQIAVAARGRRASSVEVVVDRIGRAYDDRRRELPVHRTREVPLEVGGEVDVDDLPGRVHPRVGPARAHDGRWHGEAGRPSDGACQRACDRGEASLVGEAPEPAAVVGEQEPPASDGGQTNSMRAMGALSPGRGPSFRIRV